MRATLACTSCRRSKIKCVHDGTPPCRACRKGLRQATCVLLAPQASDSCSRRLHRNRASLGIQKSRPCIRPAVEQANETITVPETARPQPLAPLRPSLGVSPPPSNSELADTPAWRTETPIQDVPTPLLIEAGRNLVAKIPAVSFIHPPTFLQALRAGQVDPLKLCAILCLCARYVPELVALHGSVCMAGKVYADYVRREVNAKIGEGPNLEIVQCLILLGMYEWGEGDGFSAWMYIGMAIRMCQALKPYSNPDSVTTSALTETEIIREEIRGRTVWSCFCVDRLLSCGKDRPTVFIAADMRIPLPLSESDFAFGQARAPRRYLFSDPSEHPRSYPLENYFAIILQGIEIWERLSRWTADGGIRQHHGPNDSPWNSESAWDKISRDLENWYCHLDDRTRYSPTKAAAQLTQSHSEAFVVINVTYYLCRLFLHRDFIPLAPLGVTGPAGPTGCPPFRDTPPPGWWESSVETLQHAADSISDMLEKLLINGNPLLTPFLGFSALSATMTHLHVAAFPFINLGRSARPIDKAETGLKYLTECATLYPLCSDWIIKVTETRALFERASNNQSRYSDSLLGDRVSEYSSLISKVIPSNRATIPCPEDAATNQRNLAAPARPSLQIPPTARMGDVPPSEFPMSDFSALWELDEEFWRLDDALLGSLAVDSNSAMPRPEGL